MLKQKKIKIEKDKIAVKINIIVSILLIAILFFVSIGFALYNKNLLFNGSISFGEQGKFAIISVDLMESSNVAKESVPSYTDETIDFNLVFSKQVEDSNIYMAKYKIVLKNDSFYDYDCNFSEYHPNITNSKGESIDLSALTCQIDGLAIGESIKAGETKEVTVTITFVPPDENETYDVEGEFEPEIIEKPFGNVLGSIPDNASGNLQLSLGNNRVSTTLSLLNSFQSDREITLSISNPNFKIVNSSGENIGKILIKAGETKDVTIYIQRIEGAEFTSSPIKTSINLSYNDITYDCGTISLDVDIKEDVVDKTPPIISNVTAQIQNATSDDTSNNKVGSVRVSWNVDDENIDHYTVLVYKGSGNNATLLNQYTTTNRYYVVDGLEDANYEFRVYGTDNSENKNTASQADINNATTADGYCSKTTNVSYKWHFTVTTNLTYVTESNTNKKVNRGYDFTTTVTKNADSSNNCGGTTTYKLPSSITVKMGNTTLQKGSSSGQYQYTGSTTVSSGVITVYGVTDNLTITVTGTAS